MKMTLGCEPFPTGKYNRSAPAPDVEQTPLRPSGDSIVAKVGKVLAAARTAGLLIIFMRHMSVPRSLTGRFQMRQAMAWQRTSDPAEIQPWFLRASEGFDIVPELTPEPDEAVLDKITFSAF